MLIITCQNILGMMLDGGRKMTVSELLTYTNTIFHLLLKCVRKLQCSTKHTNNAHQITRTFGNYDWQMFQFTVHRSSRNAHFGAPCTITVRSLFSEFAHLWRGLVLLFILLLFFIIFSPSLNTKVKYS